MELESRANKRKQSFDTSSNSSQDAALDLSSQSSTSSGGSTTAGCSRSQSPNSSSMGDFPCPKSMAKFNRTLVKKATHEYSEKRARNNVAVRRSREKSRQKLDATLTRVEELTKSNATLNQSLEILTKEVKVIRMMYNQHLRSVHNISLPEDTLNVDENH